MEKSLRWQLLSEQERIDCIGQLQDFRCCSKFAWSVTGALELDWNNRVQPVVSTLLNQNYKEVFGKSGVQPLLSVHLWLLSSANNPVGAEPTIFILTRDKKTASRARKLILRHDLFRNLDTGYSVAYEGISILFRAHSDYSDEEINNTKRSTMPMQPQALCGASVVVVAQPEYPRRLQRLATICCVVRFGSYFFAVLPAHVFSTEDDNRILEGDSNSTDSPSSSSTSVAGSICTSLNSIGAPQDHGILPDRDTEVHCYKVYLRLSQSVSLDDINELQYLGFYTPFRVSMTRISHPMHNFDLDYALVELSESSIWPNWIHIPFWGKSCYLESWNTKTPSGAVVIASGSRGAQEVQVSSSAVTLFSPYSTMPSKVWQLNFTLLPGDSGSVIFDQNGEIIGMAIATIPEVNITYVMPAEAIFEHVWSSLKFLIVDDEIALVPRRYMLVLPESYGTYMQTRRPNNDLLGKPLHLEAHERLPLTSWLSKIPRHRLRLPSNHAAPSVVKL